MSAVFLTETLQSRRDWQEVFQAMKSKDLPSKAITENRRTDKELPRQDKVKGVHHHQISILWNVTGSFLRKREGKKDQNMINKMAINTLK